MYFQYCRNCRRWRYISPSNCLAAHSIVLLEGSLLEELSFIYEEECDVIFWKHCKSVLIHILKLKALEIAIQTKLVSFHEIISIPKLHSNKFITFITRMRKLTEYTDTFISIWIKWKRFIFIFNRILISTV